jgi:hypothetical protein
VKFVISTDAHHPKHLLNMPFGVTMARRGWLEAGRRDEYPALRAVPAGPGSKMKLVSSKELLKTGIFRVTEDHAIDPEGFEIKRAIVQHQGSAVMMPIDEKRRILLVKQYRLPARQYLWELPAGRMDEGKRRSRRRSANSRKRRD